jgi:hypothetical protein
LRFEPGDRRRMIIAIVLTAVSIPFLLNGRNGRPAAAPGLGGPDLAQSLNTTSLDGAAGPTVSPSTNVALSSSSSVNPADSTIPFLVGPSTTAPAPPILIAVPAVPTKELQGLAIYRTFPASWANLPRVCVTASIRGGTTITITNLNNARSTTCIAATNVTLPPDHVIAMTDAIFGEIADVIDSPIPVKISWP